MAAMVRGLGTSPLALRYRLEFVTSYRHGAGPARRLAIFALAIARLAAWCLRPGGGVVHVHTAVRGSWYRKAICVVVARALRCRVVLQLHAGPVDIAEFWERLSPRLRTLLRWAFKRADRVLSVSAAGAQALEARLGLERVVVVPNAAPEPPAQPLPSGGRPDDGAIRMLYVGGFRDAAKGGRVLLAALPQALASNPALRAELAGPGMIPAAADAFLASEERVRWLGWLDEHAKAAALARADIVVVPSLSEGLPIWLLEAMVAGRAIVATRTGGMPEVLSDDVDGVLVAPADPAALASAINALARDPDRRASLGRAARERVARLNHDEVYGRLAAIYDELVG
jgi:glycosyltransferase involved in cell wall biosynthesis